MPLLHLEPLPRSISKSDVLAFLHTVGDLDRSRVGRIDLSGGEATIEIPDRLLHRLAKTLDGQTLGDRPVRAWAEGQSDLDRADQDHFDRLARLLDIESRAESTQLSERGSRLSPADAERNGTSLVDLVIADEDTGLGGRRLLQLAKRKPAPLPWTRLEAGSPVLLSANTRKPGDGYRGVVFERSEASLKVALGSMSDDIADHETWRLDLSNDEVSSRRQRTALLRAKSAHGDRLAQLRDVLMGKRPAEFSPQDDQPAIDTGLNHTQREAVRFALSARDVALIHGPPGTGKTTTVVELIRRAVSCGQKVLASAPSNMGVDNIFERLIQVGERAVRLGHPARVMPELRARTLDLLVKDHADVRLSRKLVKEAMGLFRQAGRYTRARPEPGARQEARSKAKSLLADARRLEAQAVQQILDTADVLCVTTTGLNSRFLGTRRFDLAVIDEACQSTEPGCWIPLPWCDRVVLAGDHCQLPPTVVSPEAAAQGLSTSLFERFLALGGPSSIARRLTVQYRMHEAIMDFSSLEFYDADLQADASVRRHLLADLPHVVSTPLTQSPLEFIDTAGAGFDEEIEPDGVSRLNQPEATLACRKVNQLLDSGVAPKSIGVISPYAAQVRLLRELLPDTSLEVDSVDGFQGREKEAIVISLVRSNPKGDIGFLKDIRRMNVAMTRARRKLLVIGDSATLSANPFYRRMIDYFEASEAYHTVWEEDAPV